VAKLPDIGLTYIVGDQPEAIRIEPDPERLSLYGITLQQLSAKIEGANRSFLAGTVRDGGRQIDLVAGETLQGAPEIGNLLLTARDGRPVYVRDVADIRLVTETKESRVGESRKTDGEWRHVPSVSLAIAKRPGTNAVVIAEEIVHRLEAVRGQIVPDDVTLTVTRNYGETADEKANELLFHLGSRRCRSSSSSPSRSAGARRSSSPSSSRRPSSSPSFAANVMGYTLNRVSLFALIFSIGILVDDAIVVIENITPATGRWWTDQRPGGDRGGRRGRQPTIVATLTVVAASSMLSSSRA
jgi:multidrug efflux pump subunit AcrB